MRVLPFGVVLLVLISSAILLLLVSPFNCCELPFLETAHCLNVAAMPAACDGEAIFVGMKLFMLALGMFLRFIAVVG